MVLVVPVPDEGIASMVEDASSVDFDRCGQVKQVGDAVGCQDWCHEFLNGMHDGIEGWHVVDNLLYDVA